MLEAPKTLTRLATRRRAPAFVGILALALLHVSAVAHQFEHSADHGLGVCAACGAYSQLEDTALPCVPSAEIVVALYGAVARPRAAAFETPLSATYQSRAPPLS
jgi:hypothetical protein